MSDYQTGMLILAIFWFYGALVGLIIGICIGDPHMKYLRNLIRTLHARLIRWANQRIERFSKWFEGWEEPHND